MKFCSKCGNQMADDMLFCQKCGTKVEFVTWEEPEEKVYNNTTQCLQQDIINSGKEKPRRLLKGIAVFCFFGGGLMLLMSMAIDSSMFIGAIGYGILGLMFWILSKTPKGSAYVLGKDKGIKVSTFILACVFLLCAAVIIFPDAGEFSKDSNAVSVTSSQNIENNTIETKKVSIADVEKWYKNEMPAVSQALIEYAKCVDGISNVNITESKFRFGEEDGWYDCHYTYYFTCYVDDQKCMGEARAFRKYNDTDIDWFHFEIVRDSDWLTIVEEYDDLYDSIIENYYKELVSQHK